MKQNEIILARHFDVSRVKGLLFDVDGTLSDTDDRLIHRISRYLAPIARLHKEQGAHHLARTLVMAMETPANTIYHLFDRVHLDQPLSKIYDWLSRKRNKKKSMQDRFWIIPGVKNMLDDFDGRMHMRSAWIRTPHINFWSTLNCSSILTLLSLPRPATTRNPFPTR